MASFVREILSATGHLGEKEDLCAKASRLKGRVNELKVRNILIRRASVRKCIYPWFGLVFSYLLKIYHFIGWTIMQN